MSSESRGTPPSPGALYLLGVLGSWVWFWQQADGTGAHLWSIVQGVVWPAYMTYRGFDALN